MPLAGPQLEVRTTTRPSGEVDTVQKVRLTEKVPALRALAEHVGLMKMRLEVDAPTTITVIHQRLPDSPPNGRKE